jgi:L-alanine-DL-glutamate epimerase-like enolase superfamily enzyme
VRSGRQKHAAAAVSPKRYGLGTLGVWQIVRCGHNQPNDPSPSFRHDSRTRPRLPSRRGRAGGAAEPDASRPAVAIPVLASLVCASPFDIAIHDAYGELHGIDTFQTYGPEHLAFDLAALLEPAAGSGVCFRGRFPADSLVIDPAAVPRQLPAWHLVGGLDPLTDDDRTGSEPDDGYPVTLLDWIDSDGLRCLKVKLTGSDAGWDFRRLVRVGEIAIERGCTHLSADFNCTVTDPAYVNEILDRLARDHPRIFTMILYVEQPFPYELEEHLIDVRSVSARKPLFLDESGHDWKLVRLGRELGWSGVALKTCKTQTGAILAACWARAHGMPLMVQDLTNPMLAQIPHCRLAAHTATIMGVETNAMQFYPAASGPEARVHPGLYRRRHGRIDLSSIGPTGFGYRVAEIGRELPDPCR